MIVNGVGLLTNPPIKNMMRDKVKAHGVSHGLSEVGYDLRVKQEVMFFPPDPVKIMQAIKEADLVSSSFTEEEINEAFYGFTLVRDLQTNECVKTFGRTALASSIEEFQVPTDMWGELRNKSTWARHFVDATIGTDMEPGWKGFLTIEIIFHANEMVTIPAGAGIAKAVFHELKYDAFYQGKYQNQDDRPVPPILE